MPIALILHGGAWAIPDNQVDAHVEGCRAALNAGWEQLRNGADALAVVELVIRQLEDDPAFNAGTGAVLNSAGMAELDAAVMEGKHLHYGAVVNLQRIRNPISLARRVLEGPATMLAAQGAEQFALSQGLPLCDNHELIIEREQMLYERWRATAHDAVATPVSHDTVGAIALDRAGNLVAGNSTGGTPFKLPGRVGDTPLVGCGLYADNQFGAAICTGWGESIVRVALARRAIELVERGQTPQVAVEQAVRHLTRTVKGAGVGCLMVSPSGAIGMAWSTPRMAYAYQTEAGGPAWGC
jgi:beta-aspartyl-peptidase (threonine type)